MKSRTVAVALVLAVGTVALAKGEYAGGSGPAVKAWTPKPFDATKDSFQPLAIYVYDSSVKVNGFAKALEGKDGLETDAIKTALEKFAKIKIKSDGSDAKGWAPALLADAKGGSSLVLMSADAKLQRTFDKNTPGGNKGHGKDAILLALEEILAYESKQKVEKLKHEKADEAATAAATAKAEKEKPTEVVKPLVGLEEKPKPVAKTETKKAADPKKPADPKPVDAKKAADTAVADAKAAEAKAVELKKAADTAVAAAKAAEAKAVEAKKAADPKVAAAKPGDATTPVTSKDPKKKAAEDE
jgi:hypothetical protein